MTQTNEQPTRPVTLMLAQTLLVCAAFVMGPIIQIDATSNAGAAQAQAQATKQKSIKIAPYVILRADEISFNDKSKIATARGKVEISHKGRFLRADTVTYEEKTDTFSVIGNVTMVEPNGDVIFGERSQFTNQFKDGFIEGFRMLFTDNTRLAAPGGQRTGGVITRLRNAIFSPCNLCEKDPSRAPLWRIRSVRVIHDGEAKNISYKDAYFEFFGVPVAYTPYFSHPDPNVKRRSGFLTPSYSENTDFGFSVRLPYFWALSEQEDVTLTPILNTNEASVLHAEYRRSFTNGELSVDTSITNPERREGETKIGGNEIRGHVLLDGKFSINPTWRTNFQYQRTSDDTYLRRYSFHAPDNQTLTSSANIEGFQGHKYVQLSGYHFHGLRETDNPDEAPLVMPFGQYSFVSESKAAGSYITADASMLAMHRDDGVDSRRLSLKGGWHLPYTAPGGDIYEMSALQSDIYSVSDVTNESGTGTQDGFTGRVQPQLSFKWRYPFVRKEKASSQLLEPIVSLIVSPNGGNPSKIPNEDSQDIEFDDTNLFSANRYTGVDRVDGGQRLVYGLNWGLYGDKGGSIEAFLGQSLRLRSATNFASGSGLRDKKSDLVGKLRINPNSYLDFLYRFRIDPDGPTANRNEFAVSAGPSRFRASLNYIFISEEAGTGEFGDREEITGTLNAEIDKFWQARAYIRKDLTDNGGLISESLGLRYADECFIFDATFTRSFTQDRDLKPIDTLLFMLTFKHLGAVRGAG